MSDCAYDCYSLCSESNIYKPEDLNADMCAKDELYPEDSTYGMPQWPSAMFCCMAEECTECPEADFLQEYFEQSCEGDESTRRQLRGAMSAPVDLSKFSGASKTQLKHLKMNL